MKLLPSAPLDRVLYYLGDFWKDHGDPRVQHYPFISNAQPALFLLLSYLAFVYYFGPRYMANRKPYSLKWPMIIYNCSMSLMNLYFFIQILRLHNFGLDCFKTDFPSLTDTSPPTLAIIDPHYLYVVSKFIDLLDTVFFVLRKKYSQITLLHVYHHFTVPIEGWTYFRLCGNESVAIPFGTLNSLVHTMMYAYYGLAAFGPHMQKYLTWKRYLTQIQIAQFAALLSFSIYFLLNQRGYPMYFTLNMLIQSILYIVLFVRFYLNTYRKSVKKD